jgi:hypothetical protein
MRDFAFAQVGGHSRRSMRGGFRSEPAPDFCMRRAAYLSANELRYGDRRRAPANPHFAALTSARQHFSPSTRIPLPRLTSTRNPVDSESAGFVLEHLRRMTDARTMRPVGTCGGRLASMNNFPGAWFEGADRRGAEARIESRRLMRGRRRSASRPQTARFTNRFPCSGVAARPHPSAVAEMDQPDCSRLVADALQQPRHRGAQIFALEIARKANGRLAIGVRPDAGEFLTGSLTVK